jgi:hypothetical protein
MAKPTREYLKGRRSIDGRKLRYAACIDILIVVHRILTEYVEDCESPYFHCEHPELLRVKGLLRPDVTDMNTLEMGKWLSQVAEILPTLWD